MGRTFLGLGVLAMLGLLTGADAVACPGRYKGFDGKCYGFFPGGSYPEAVRFCSRQGAQLYMMRNPTEVFRLKQLLSKQPLKSFWVGLTDENTSRTWAWSNGDALGVGDFTDWGNPADNDDQACVYARKESGYKWAVTGCGQKKAFICKKDP
ncbi:struthiocalcin-2-like [Branchiostoma floridae]|uniref:Struthiocalcin-2-like n=1 Tax=Branchiostoma floridae TaxID=7739 RepID=A0A9J7KL34_BRAFL|nr:struthiocalcin-2-like [Branchiostoma floridae]